MTGGQDKRQDDAKATSPNATGPAGATDSAGAGDVAPVPGEAGSAWDVMRFADREMSADEERAFLESAAEDPATLRRVLADQRLRDAARRAWCDCAPPAPADLRARCAALCDEVKAADGAAAATAHASVTASPAPAPVLAVLGRWAPIAVAAVLAVAAFFAIFNTGNEDGLDRGSLVVPAAMAQAFQSRHVACANELASPYDINLPTEVTELRPAMQEHFAAAEVAALDLSSLGYEFDRAGECMVPGRGAVHLIYRARPGEGRHDSVSLWMRKDDGSLAIEEGRVYAAGRVDQPHPMLVWRQGGVVYYLVGDDRDRIRAVAEAMRPSGNGAIEPA